MELFGLKNENGKDVRLIVTDNPYTHPHPIIKVEAIEPNETQESDVLFKAIRTMKEYKELDEELKPEPKFKVGDWVMPEENDDEENYYPKRIIATGNMIKYLKDIEDLESWTWFPSHRFRLATPQEIELHLRKICDEKGFRNGVKIRGLAADAKPFHSCYVIETPFQYEEGEDSLVALSGDRVYCKGKFAEIVADEFLKLPKTVDELVLLLQDFDRDGGQLTPWGFLTERGYKTT